MFMIDTQVKKMVLGYVYIFMGVPSLLKQRHSCVFWEVNDRIIEILSVENEDIQSQTHTPFI